MLSRMVGRLFPFAILFFFLPIAAAASAPTEMPQGLWEAFTKARHQIQPVKSRTGEPAKEVFRAQNPGNGLRFRFEASGVRIESSRKGNGWHATMTLAQYGQEGKLESLPAAEVAVDGQRISYRRGAVAEWYLNTPQGLEQGFDLEKPEGYRPDKPLLLTLAVGGDLQPKWRSEGKALAFHTPAGRHAFDYDKLEVVDAKGKALPARLALAEKAVEIHIEAGDASWPIIVDPLISSQTEVLRASISGNEAGYAVALDGDRAVIGEPGDLSDAGLATVFTKTGGIWDSGESFWQTDYASGDRFGAAVAIYGDTILVGAPGDDGDDSGSQDDRGAAYVFEWSGLAWEEQEKLQGFPEGLAEFGYAIALDRDRALIGAPGGLVSNGGSAYVFTRTAGVYAPYDVELYSQQSQSGDRFASAVALDGDTALIGALGDDGDDSGTQDNMGAAYFFTWTGTSWNEQQKLAVSGGAANDRFGNSLDLSGDTAIVGAPWASSFFGRAYIFVYDGNAWNQQAKLIASDESSDSFGWSVALSGNTAVVGASTGDDGVTLNTGSAYVFSRVGTTWLEQAELTSGASSTPVPGENFGTSVAISGDTIAAGARNKPCTDGGQCGAAYVDVFNCGFGGGLVADRWTMIGIPCELPPVFDSESGYWKDEVGYVFDELDPSQYGVSWRMYRRNASLNRYEMLDDQYILNQYEGYWIYWSDPDNILEGTVWHAEGDLTNYSDDGTGDCVSPNGCFEVFLESPVDPAKSRWNLVGHPGNIAADWADVRVRMVNDNNSPYTPESAASNNLVSNTIYKWNGNAYDSYDDCVPGMTGELASHEGIWVEVLGGATGQLVSLLIPHGKSSGVGGPPGPPGCGLPEVLTATIATAGTTNEKGRKNQEEAPPEWYLRLVAEAPAEKLLDKGNLLGQLVDGKYGFDRNDLKELAPFAAPYLTVLFPHGEDQGDWDGPLADYASDYHPVDFRGADEWQFIIKSDQRSRDVALRWDFELINRIDLERYKVPGWWDRRGDKLLKRMWIEDPKAGKSFRLSEQTGYSFNMAGDNVRTFVVHLDPD